MWDSIRFKNLTWMVRKSYGYTSWMANDVKMDRDDATCGCCFSVLFISIKLDSIIKNAPPKREKKNGMAKSFYIIAHTHGVNCCETSASSKSMRLQLLQPFFWYNNLKVAFAMKPTQILDDSILLIAYLQMAAQETYSSSQQIQYLKKNGINLIYL